jgi:hypothetical protein
VILVTENLERSEMSLEQHSLTDLRGWTIRIKCSCHVRVFVVVDVMAPCVDEGFK